MTVTGPSVPVFEGVRVELAQFVFVPACGALLADWGADVIKRCCCSSWVSTGTTS
jgi:crotonobetainyl-CoA:carnitine CoA-transferase CaiB-like acyl-CoA transferase